MASRSIWVHGQLQFRTVEHRSEHPQASSVAISQYSSNMSTKLFVGNLSYSVTENDLEDLFAQHGSVREVNLILDRATNRSRGFGFVTMDDRQSADAAVEALNGTEWEGRTLTVNEARPRESGGGGGGGGGGGRDSRSNKSSRRF